jgi:hypothetical protein
MPGPELLEVEIGRKLREAQANGELRLGLGLKTLPRLQDSSSHEHQTESEEAAFLSIAAALFHACIRRVSTPICSAAKDQAKSGAIRSSREAGTKQTSLS